MQKTTKTDKGPHKTMGVVKRVFIRPNIVKERREDADLTRPFLCFNQPFDCAAFKGDECFIEAYATINVELDRVSSHPYKETEKRLKEFEVYKIRWSQIMNISDQESNKGLDNPLNNPNNPVDNPETTHQEGIDGKRLFTTSANLNCLSTTGQVRAYNEWIDHNYFEVLALVSDANLAPSNDKYLKRMREKKPSIKSYFLTQKMIIGPKNVLGKIAKLQEKNTTAKSSPDKSLKGEQMLLYIESVDAEDKLIVQKTNVLASNVEEDVFTVMATIIVMPDDEITHQYASEIVARGRRMFAVKGSQIISLGEKARLSQPSVVEEKPATPKQVLDQEPTNDQPIADDNERPKEDHIEEKQPEPEAEIDQKATQSPSEPQAKTDQRDSGQTLVKADQANGELVNDLKTVMSNLDTLPKGRKLKFRVIEIIVE